MYLKNLDVLAEMQEEIDRDANVEIDPTEDWESGRDVAPLVYGRVEGWTEFVVSYLAETVLF